MRRSTLLMQTAAHFLTIRYPEPFFCEEGRVRQSPNWEQMLCLGFPFLLSELASFLFIPS